MGLCNMCYRAVNTVYCAVDHEFLGSVPYRAIDDVFQGSVLCVADSWIILYQVTDHVVQGLEYVP